MNKLIQAHLFICLFCAVHHFSYAQNVRMNTGSGHPVYPASTDGIQPTTIQEITIGEEKKNTIVLKPSQSTNKLIKEKNSEANSTQSITTIDKNNNPHHRLTSTEKEEQIIEEKNSEDKKRVDNNELSKTNNIYPDLQVTATKEEIIPVQNVGTERLPNLNLITEPTNTEQIKEKKTTETPPQNGKAEFLKQYVKELKQEIEKNKNNPNYPASAKQQEVEEIENLFKQ